jgi:3-dehydroquinate dehydratase
VSDHASIVTSILPADVDAAAREIGSVPPGPDPIELRADRLAARDVAALVAGTARRLIVAVRRVTNGGCFDGTEKARRKMLQAALDAGADWIDVEWGSELGVLAAGPHANRVILSDHGVPCERDALGRRFEKMSESPAARLKIVARAERPSQIVAIRDLLRDRVRDHADGKLDPLLYAMARLGINRLLGQPLDESVEELSPDLAGRSLDHRVQKIAVNRHAG